MKRLTLLLSMVMIPLGAAGAPEKSGQMLREIVKDYTDAVKREDAFNAPYFNVEEDLDKFGDYLSPAYFERQKSDIKKALAKLKAVHKNELTGNDLILYSLFKHDLEVSLKHFDYPYELLEFTQMGNRLRSYLDDASPSLTSFPFDSVKHYEDFVKRSDGFPAYIDRQIATFRRGIKEKITLNCAIIDKTLHSYSDGLEENPEKNPFWRPLDALPANVSKADRSRLRSEFRQMIVERIVPGFKKFDRFFRGEYRDHCRKSFGIGQLPNGKAWYAHAILAQTDTTLSAERIHEIGLKEVKRIESEMAEVQNELGYGKESRHQFLQSLQTDPRFFYTSREQLASAFKSVKESVAALVPKYFSLTPKMDFSFVNAENPEDVANYRGPTEYKPIGRFVVPMNVRSVPKYEVTTLMLHETVPGHHLQIALQYEMKDKLSEYQRKIFESNAFTEGWALYSEYLGREMGLFKDPLQRLGNLNDELLRAVRLVVDTGIHAKGWSHDKTVAYMKQHLASDDGDIEVEANRYSVWPAQALAYKLGQLKIIELRQRAEKALGPRFDIKEFHRVVVGNGTVSLQVLEQQVDAWIKDNQSLRVPAANG